MKKSTFFFLLICSMYANAQKNDIQKTIDVFFEGFHAKDTMKMKTVCSNKIIMKSISEKGEKSVFSDVKPSAFFKTIATLPPTLTFEERILDCKTQIDGSMAHAWAPYELYLDGKLYSSGVNAFTLVKENQIWQIIFLIDTRRQQPASSK